MHVVIAWWDGTRSAGNTRQESAGRPHDSGLGSCSLTDDFPGLRTSHWLTDPTADRQGLALLWDSATSAARSLPALAMRTFGCAPSHRWAFELDTPDHPKPDGPLRLPQELSLLLHA
ncbi:hypothetical protein [Streptomyces sp. MBT33]|uniref:hypothetical protein n=1 Tax=Streptomyces sp. MBT33 TaxID=1488363 RepID=UPI00190DF2E5|nr:hypothetical protein [Streptomyces sp. MBT33]MBK3643352.1 hypothetical protein [Streptomyces sp. MBT33]